MIQATPIIGVLQGSMCSRVVPGVVQSPIYATPADVSHIETVQGYPLVHAETPKIMAPPLVSFGDLKSEGSSPGVDSNSTSAPKKTEAHNVVPRLAATSSSPGKNKR